MNKEQILNIIKENPQMSYEDLKKQATGIGVPMDLFEEAWGEFSGTKTVQGSPSSDPNIGEMEVERVPFKNKKKALVLLIVPPLAILVVMVLYTVLMFVDNVLG